MAASFARYRVPAVRGHVEPILSAVSLATSRHTPEGLHQQMSSSTRERARLTCEAQMQACAAHILARRPYLMVMVYCSPGPYTPLRIAASCLVLRLFVPYIAARGIAEIEELLSKL